MSANDKPIDCLSFFLLSKTKGVELAAYKCNIFFHGYQKGVRHAQSLDKKNNIKKKASVLGILWHCKLSNSHRKTY